MRLSPHISLMQQVAQKAGRSLMRDFLDVETLQVHAKSHGDFVSEADLKAETIIREELDTARPGYAFLLEESGSIGSDKWAWQWIVDPLDGTTNFLHGIPHWAISIGLQKRLDNGTTEMHAAVIFNPVTNEMFWAEKGTGAWLNNHRLRVSGRKNISEALFATGIPFAKTPVEKHKPFGLVLGALMPKAAGIRRLGSAALDLASIAAGRYEGFWELGLKPWDCAAGAVLIREAGGIITSPDGKPLSFDFTSKEEAQNAEMDIVAGNSHFQPQICKLVSDALKRCNP